MGDSVHNTELSKAIRSMHVEDSGPSIDRALGYQNPFGA